MAAEVDVNDWKSVLSAVVLGTLGVLSFIVQPALVQGFVAHLRMAEAEAVNLAGVEMAGVALAAIVIPLLGARLDWRRALLVALLLAVGGNISSALAIDGSWLWSARFIAGLGHGALISLSFSFVGLTQRVDRNVALYLTALLSYGALGIWAMPALLDAIGLRGLFLIFAAMLALGLLTVPHVPRAAGARGDIPPNARALAAGLTVTALAGVLCYNLALGIAWATLFLAGIDAGLGEQPVANALFLSQLVAILGALSSVVLADRLDRRIAVALGILGGGACIALLLFKPGFALFLISVCGFNILWNFVLPFILGAVGEFDTRGLMVGRAIAMQMLGLGGGPFIAALLMGSRGYAPVEIVCVAFFVASYLLLIVPMRRHRVILARD